MAVPVVAMGFALPPVAFAQEAQEDDESSLTIDAGFMSDDNVTRAKEGANKLSDSSFSVNLSNTLVHPLTRQSRLLVTGSLNGESFQYYKGLNRIGATLEGEYQYRESSEFDAPIFGVFARFTAEDFESDVRDGVRYSVGVSMRKPVTDRISTFAALSYNRRFGRSAVFQTTDTSARMNLDYALSRNETIYLGAEYRRGDVVSTGVANLESVTISKVFVLDDAFPGRQFFSYQLYGNTILTTLGYNIGLGSGAALDFSWRRVESEPDIRPSWSNSPRSYISNQLFATYLLSF